MKYILKRLLATIILIVTIAGCEQERYVTVKPEHIIVERTSAPFAGAVWIDPEYRWSDGTYVVEPAHWTKSQGSGVWIPGHWKQTPKGYTWVSGYWK